MQSTSSLTDPDSDPLPNRARWLVMKFGGTSVATPAQWDTIIQLAQSRIDAGYRPMLVCSAIRGVSNILEDLPDRVVAGLSTDDQLNDLRELHANMLAGCGEDADDLVAPFFRELSLLLQAIEFTQEVTPKTRARILALGELMSTRLGACYCRRQGLDTEWIDARELLMVEPTPHQTSGELCYLSGTCSHEPNIVQQACLATRDADVMLTQGFLAQDSAGDTVLLGRGGSDTSAAYLGAQLNAARIEIWTDVPGVFSANPKYVEEAYLVRELSYDEALMLASLGVSVLHPRAIAPARDAGIPIEIRCLSRPAIEGTRITARAIGSHAPSIMAVTSRDEVWVVHASRPGDWQQVGFLADVTGCFKDLGLSIDLISTSPTHIHATLDPASGQVTPEVVDELLRRLGAICEVEIRCDTASVSIVGSRLRENFQELATSLTALQGATIHLVAQAANDSHFTIVVPQAATRNLVRDLHSELFGGTLSSELFGDSWTELMSGVDHVEVSA